MPATEKLPKKHVKCVPIGSVLVYLDPALGLVVTSGSCQGAPAAVIDRLEGTTRFWFLACAFLYSTMINPQNEAAKKGLERLEKQMKGVDPDAPEEDEDNEADDIDADQDDAELL